MNLGRIQLAVATASAIALPLTMLTVAGAQAADQVREHSASQLLASQLSGLSAAASQAGTGAKAAQRAQALRSSASDFADGATRRTARLVEVSVDSAPSDRQRLLRADVTQDLVAKKLKATLTFRAAPTASADSLVFVYFGRWDGNTCLGDAVIAAAAYGNATFGTFFDNSGNPSTEFAVSKSRDSAVLKLTSAANATFRTAAYDCAFARVTGTGEQGTYFGFYAEDLVTQFKPKFSIAGGEPVQAAPKGKWVNMRLEVYNGARSPVSGVTITGGGKGLKFSPRSRNLGTIDDRSTKYGIKMKVRVAQGAKPRKATFTVKGNGVTKKKSFTIGVSPKPKKYAPLAGRYFWGSPPPA